jgi:hypothetical protein
MSGHADPELGSEEPVTLQLTMALWRWNQIVRSLHGTLNFGLADFIEDVLKAEYGIILREAPGSGLRRDL